MENAPPEPSNSCDPSSGSSVADDVPIITLRSNSVLPSSLANEKRGPTINDPNPQIGSSPLFASIGYAEPESIAVIPMFFENKYPKFTRLIATPFSAKPASSLFKSLSAKSPVGKAAPRVTDINPFFVRAS